MHEALKQTAPEGPKSTGRWSSATIHRRTIGISLSISS